MNKIIILTVASLLAMPSAYAVSCKSFSSQAEAQAYFNANGAKKLDRDHDGIACEHLAGGKRGKAKHSTKTTKVKTTSTKTKPVTTVKNPF